ncbi:MAG: CPBP family intramembrane metalloprotease [Chlorobiaceae bacterium]|nr:CPBP family intramembrane metalloprotease [Chlorobiaceae bacterium]
MLPNFDRFAGRRPSFIVNTLLLAVLMVLYLLSGAVLLLFLGGQGSDVSELFTPESVRRLSGVILLSQGGAQLLLLAFPVLILAALHTRSRNPFSRESLAFLGIADVPDIRVLLLATAGIFLLQPLIFTITSFEQLYLWPALGRAGEEVLRQQQQMDMFIKSIATVNSLTGFAAVLLVFALVPALSEELLFRGYIQKNYTRSMSPRNAVALTGLVFAFFHMSPANLLSLALLGWFIGYIYARSGNLAVSAFAHFSNNFGALLVLFFTESSGAVTVEHPERAIYSIWWWLLVAVSMMLFILAVRGFSIMCQAKEHEFPER